ncbi:uncharacterized protein C5orf34 homolog isoform X2 [Pseudophryne corroboree]
MSSGCAMFLYADDSVEAQYRGGGRLCLSPCGAEFMYERPRAGGHPVQGPERGRHRTEFVTSSCRDQVLHALNFRNTFASRPFLPSSLIPSEKRISLLTEISEVTWPTVEDDTRYVAHLDDGRVKVSSLDGYAHLYMTPLQKEFTVEFLCQLSCTIPAPDTASHSKDLVNSDPRAAGNKTPRDIGRTKYSSCVFNEETQLFVTKHAFHYTWLVQRFSVSCCPESLQYPMGLALHFHRQKEPADICETTAVPDHSEHLENVSFVPRALPLRCPATHMHRSNFWNVSLEKDNESTVHPLPLKVVMCNDILYRFFLEGTNLVEIHPGDGSVFLSVGESMGKYFKHYFLTGDTKRAEDRLYTVRELPPDKPRALYSVRSIISQARRFLESCCRNKLSLNALSHTCCWKMEHGPDGKAAVPVLLEQSFIPDRGSFAVYSDNMVLASYLDGVLLYMTWSFANFNKGEELQDSTAPHRAPSASKHQHFGWCCLRLPNGSSELVELECPGEYASYIRTAAEWCHWLDEKTLQEMLTPAATEH